MSTRNISFGGKRSLCVGLTNLLLACAECVDILGAAHSWSSQALPTPVQGQLYYKKRTLGHRRKLVEGVDKKLCMDRRRKKTESGVRSEQNSNTISMK